MRRVSPKIVERVMRTLGHSIEGMELPAIEKISSDQQADPFRILIGTLLSARTQDATTHAASTRLFRAACTPTAMAALTVDEIEQLIYPVGFYRNKAKFVKATCAALDTRFGGTVPRTLAEMVTLPGVGRKTANLVMIRAFHSNKNICVDTHVHRIANRMGWVTTREPHQTELALYRATEERWWPYLNRYLVTWGQNVCRPVYPKCGDCVLAPGCPRLGVEKVGRRSRV
ncbi:MAG: endonuclease III [Acidobacteria bacterium]|nr:endonuclease III [Acidobacteriota bacterium]